MDANFLIFRQRYRYHKGKKIGAKNRIFVAQNLQLRYFIEFSYNGKNYYGYQIQPNDITVQEELEKALSTILRTEIRITGAGRTDTGVHSKKMFAHFDVALPPADKLPQLLNAFLPPDISVKRIFQVREELHARFDALYRTYEYHIDLEKNPFTTALAWQHWKRGLNVTQMNDACQILSEYNDFASFAKTGADNKTTICRIFHAGWVKDGSKLIFTISADRFLRNMVRAIVGTMVEIGSEKIQPSQLRGIIEAKDRGYAGASAPAHGLYLVDVGYDFGTDNERND